MFSEGWGPIQSKIDRRNGLGIHLQQYDSFVYLSHGVVRRVATSVYSKRPVFR